MLPASNGEYYVYRQEYKKRISDTLKAGGKIEIQDFELQQLLRFESNAPNGGDDWRKPSASDASRAIAASTGQPTAPQSNAGVSIWIRDDHAVARLPFAGSSLLFDLPAALRFEVENKLVKAEKARAAAEQRVAAIAPVSPLPTPNSTSPGLLLMTTTPAATQPTLESRHPRPSSSSQVSATTSPRGVQTSSVQNPVTEDHPLGSLMRQAIWIGILGGFVSGMKILFKGRKRRRKTPPADPTSRAFLAPPPPLPPTAVHPPAIVPPARRTVSDLDWEEFELLVAEIYRRQGYSVTLCAATGSDGGIDIKLLRDGQQTLVQCKARSRESKVSVKDIREFYGVLMSEQATNGFFVTSGSFTRDAEEFASGKPLRLIDRKALEGLVIAAQADPSDDLINVSLWAPVFFGAVTLTNPNCPFCKGPMVMRTGSHGKFWGCPSYPRCRGKREVRKHLERRG